jgi:hypothetical protein
MPQIISDGGAGSAIITWEDWRNFSQSDIYAQKISNGFTSWTFNGVLICSEPNLAHQYNTKMVADGSGGAIICWEDKRNAGTNTDLYAQRVSTSGITQWTSNGIAICTASGIQFTHQLIADATGGAVIAWEDRRTGRDIYAQRINASGAAQWTANGIIVCNDASTQSEPQLAARVSGGTIIIWTDDRNTFQQDIYAQGIDAAGNTLWAANGVPVANEAHAQSAAQLITDGSNGAMIAWQDLRTTLDYDIYSSKLFSSGTLPVSLLSFNAALNNHNVTLAWVTENEVNSSHFELEVSADGIVFTKLAIVNAKNTAGKNRYSYTDIGASGNILYYRLKQFDRDGKFIQSNALKIYLSKASAITLFPNPVSDILLIRNIDPATINTAQVISSDGKIVMQQKNTGNNLIVNIRHLSQGMYLLRILITDGSIRSLPFLKQ